MKKFIFEEKFISYANVEIYAENEEDARLIDGLNERYKQRNVQLAQRFDIDLKRWSGF